jgi:hypothetical protein
MEALDPAGREEIDRLGTADLPRPQVGVGHLLGPVGHVGQGGDDGDPVAAPGQPPGHIGLEEGGVDHVGAAPADQGDGRPGPVPAPGPAAQREHLGPCRPQVVADTGPLVQVGHIETHSPRHQRPGQAGQRGLGPTGGQAVDDVKDVHDGVVHQICRSVP